jgi:hypothetical protein
MGMNVGQPVAIVTLRGCHRVVGRLKGKTKDDPTSVGSPYMHDGAIDSFRFS